MTYEPSQETPEAAQVVLGVDRDKTVVTFHPHAVEAKLAKHLVLTQTIGGSSPLGGTNYVLSEERYIRDWSNGKTAGSDSVNGSSILSSRAKILFPHQVLYEVRRKSTWCVLTTEEEVHAGRALGRRRASKTCRAGFDS